MGGMESVFRGEEGSMEKKLGFGTGGVPDSQEKGGIVSQVFGGWEKKETQEGRRSKRGEKGTKAHGSQLTLGTGK